MILHFHIFLWWMKFAEILQTSGFNFFASNSHVQNHANVPSIFVLESVGVMNAGVHFLSMVWFSFISMSIVFKIQRSSSKRVGLVLTHICLLSVYICLRQVVITPSLSKNEICKIGLNTVKTVIWYWSRSIWIKAKAV